MHGGKRKLIKETYEKSVLKDFELKVLLSGNPDVFLPVRVISMKDSDIIFYETQSHIPISDLEFNSIFEPLTILLEVVAIIRETDFYMLYPEKIALSLNSIYINQDRKKIRCCYLKGGVETWQDNLRNLVIEMDTLINKVHPSPYFKEIENYLSKCNHSYKDIIIKVEGIIRDATISLG